MSKMLASAMDALAVIGEMVVGHRNTLIAGGVAPEAADEMAKEFHAMLLQQAVAAQPQHKKGPWRQ
jgi:hypothetical protein